MGTSIQQLREKLARTEAVLAERRLELVELIDRALRTDADICIVRIHDDERLSHEAVLVRARTTQLADAVAQVMQSSLGNVDADQHARMALTEGMAVVLGEHTEEDLVAIAGEAHREFVRALAPLGHIGVPIVLHGERLGLAALHRPRHVHPPLDEHDQAALREVVRLAGDYISRMQLVAVTRALLDTCTETHAKLGHLACTLGNPSTSAGAIAAANDLASGMAQDMADVLSVIVDYASSMAGDARALASASKQLDAVRRAGGRAQDLARQLFGYAQAAQAGPAWVELAPTLNGSVDLYRRILGDSVALTLSCVEALAPVHLDPRQLDRLILRMLIAARDAMPAGGSVHLETSPEAFLGGEPGERPARFVVVRMTTASSAPLALSDLPMLARHVGGSLTCEARTAGASQRLELLLPTYPLRAEGAALRNAKIAFPKAS